jgi:hypothetical protein
MHQIYRNSYFTIAATSAKNSSDGCFSAKTRVGPTRSFQVPGNERDVVNVFVRPVWEDERGARGHLSPSYGFPDEPLSKRAWAFQEHVLSPRTLNFVSTGIAWECEDLIECYCCTPRRLWPSEGPKGSVIKLLIQDPGGAWRNAVTSYTRRNLTFESDTLPAMAGLASYIYSSNKSHYLAGIWMFDLHLELLWYPDTVQIFKSQDRQIDRSICRRPDTYIAPSWSWASERAQVAWRLHGVSKSKESSKLGIETAKIVHAHCEVIGKNPWGAVSSGFINFYTYVAIVELGNYELFQGDGPLGEPTGATPCCRVRNVSPGESIGSSSKTTWGKEWALLDTPIFDKDVQNGEYRLVEIATKKPPSIEMLGHLYSYAFHKRASKSEFDQRETLTVYYYLLTKKSPRVPNAYERVGLFFKFVAPDEVWNRGKLENITIV